MLIHCYVGAIERMWHRNDHATCISCQTNASTNCNKTASFILKTNNVENFLKYKNEIKYLHTVPKFYEQLLDIWYSIHNKERMTVQEILQEDIWFNSNILIGNKPIYNKEWNEAGIRCIHESC